MTKTVNFNFACEIPNSEDYTEIINECVKSLKEKDVLDILNDNDINLKSLIHEIVIPLYVLGKWFQQKRQQEKEKQDGQNDNKIDFSNMEQMIIICFKLFVFAAFVSNVPMLDLNFERIVEFSKKIAVLQKEYDKSLIHRELQISEYRDKSKDS